MRCSFSLSRGIVVVPLVRELHCCESDFAKVRCNPLWAGMPAQRSGQRWPIQGVLPKSQEIVVLGLGVLLRLASA